MQKLVARVTVLGAIAVFLIAAVTPAAVQDPADEVLLKVREHAPWIFELDPQWDANLRARLAIAAKALTSDAALSTTIDLELRRVSGGTARFFSPGDQEYLALASKFSGRLDAERYLQSGAWFERRGKRWFVREALAGSPAANAGLSRGDEIVRVGGQVLAPVGSFLAGEKVRIEYRRLPWETPRTTELEPVRASTQELLLAAMRASVRLVDRQNRKLGVIWLTAASHPAFRDSLVNAAAGMQRDADALVLDLRGDFAGGDLSYADVFLGETAIYRKKLIVLSDSGTRGGKELLAGLLKKSGSGGRRWHNQPL